MLRMSEDGTMYRTRRFWDARRPSCIETAKKIEIHVGLAEFSCGLIVLAYGIVFSLVFLAIEIWFVDWTKRQCYRNETTKIVIAPKTIALY